MKKFLILLFVIIIPFFGFSQEKKLIDYDLCADNINKKSKSKLDKAYNLFSKGKYNESSDILRELITKEPEFASAYFLIALIGIEKENIATIEKFMPKVYEACPDFTHPLLYYYLGLMDYSNEKFESSKKHFNHFIELAGEYTQTYDSLINEADNYLQWSGFLDKTINEKVEFNPSKINYLCTDDDEFLPFISIDREKVFFTRRTEVKTEVEQSFYQKANIEKKELFCLSTLQKDGSYDKGFPLPEPFNMGNNEGGATLTADNRELYFTVCKPIEEYTNCDIFYSQWLGEYWSDVSSVGQNINNTGTWETQPCISPDGKTLYFVSNRPGGFGGLDIWISRKQPNGTWGKPSNAGAKINSPGDEKAPFMHPDGVSFYFSSTGWKGLGGYDLFYLKLDDKKMRSPINLGYPINTDGDEVGVYVTLGNEMAYFASNTLNKNNNWDIYRFDLNEKYQPLKAKLIKGKVIDSTNNLDGASLELIRISDRTRTNYDIDPNTGNFAMVVLEEEPYLIKAKKEGYAFESKLVKTTMEETQPKEIEMELNPLEIGASYVIKDILFATNSYELNKESQEIIDAFIEYLNEYPKIRCTIEGHTDNIGSDEDNQILSENRARTVVEYIIKSRIREDRINYKGYGAKKPVADNSTPEGRAKNRRTVFKIDSL